MPARFWLGKVSFHLSMVSRLLKCKYWRQRGNVNTMVGLPDFNFGDNIQSWVHEIGTQDGRKKVVGAADNGRSGQDQSVSHTIHSPQQLVYVCVCMGDAIFLLSVIMNMSDRRQVNHVEGMTTPSTGEQGELWPPCLVLHAIGGQYSPPPTRGRGQTVARGPASIWAAVSSKMTQRHTPVIRTKYIWGGLRAEVKPDTDHNLLSVQNVLGSVSSDFLLSPIGALSFYPKPFFLSLESTAIRYDSDTYIYMGMSHSKWCGSSSSLPAHDSHIIHDTEWVPQPTPSNPTPLPTHPYPHPTPNLYT